MVLALLISGGFAAIAAEVNVKAEFVDDVVEGVERLHNLFNSTAVYANAPKFGKPSLLENLCGVQLLWGFMGKI